METTKKYSRQATASVAKWKQITFQKKTEEFRTKEPSNSARIERISFYQNGKISTMLWDGKESGRSQNKVEWN